MGLLLPPFLMGVSGLVYAVAATPRLPWRWLIPPVWLGVVVMAIILDRIWAGPPVILGVSFLAGLWPMSGWLVR